jgi:8-oxo-dGTP diphosphatase
MGRSDIPATLDEIDWPRWQPVDRATLVFVVEGDRVLLIRKLRGLGAGKVNAPGGRIEPDESPIECAAREVEEELATTPAGLAQAGVLRFQFLDGYSIHVTVFRADRVDREPAPTEEALPLWTRVDAIPYEEMWEDDRIWLPQLLAGEPFSGRFLFDGDRLLDGSMD